jgi:carbonic anhydrase/acetyltransferase-like protein (isoleucine patch superfamily)
MLLRYLDFRPTLQAPFDLAPNAAVVGRARAGPGLVMREYATVRADGESIRVGANVFLGGRATVHIADSLLGASIGNDVTVGRFALVHACAVDDRVVVGDAAVVMDGARVGAGALLAAGSLVPPRKQLAGGWAYEGYPATPTRAIDASELAAAAAAIRTGEKSSLVTATDVPGPDDAIDAGPVAPQAGRAPGMARAYVAPTAMLSGDVTLADDASIFFGCALVAGGARIVVGPRTNVQDNSLLVSAAGRGDIRIGADVTLGHNVRMGAATIGDGALIGMGSQLGDGVVVEAGGCVGARAWVEPGTVVAANWIWVGRPARAFRPVRPDERATFAQGVAIYVRYAEAYRSHAEPRL